MRSRSAAALLLLLFLACRRDQPASRTADPAVTPQQPQAGGTLVRRLSTDINTLNMLHIGSDTERQVLALIHDPLIAIDENLRFIPALAEKWELSEDGRTFTFTLDRRATFSDGRPVRAGDVLFTIRKIVDPRSESLQFASLFETFDAEQSAALDDRTVRIVFRQAHPGQLGAFNIGILPEHVYSQGDILRDFTDRVTGSGPYLFVRRDAGRQILLERRGNYWRESPYIERILLRILPDDVAWNAIKTGAVDETRMTSDQWAMERGRPEIQQSIDIRQFYQLGYNFIAWNLRNPILADARVRRALTMAMDRQSLITNVYYGTARVITGPFTPDQWAYNASVPALAYKPEEARKLLGEAGWSDSNGDGVLDRAGKPLRLELLITNPTTRLQGQMFQDALKNIGIRLDLTQVDGATLFERVYGGKYDGASLAWSLDLDPDPYAYFHSSQFPPAGQNIGYYSNRRADELMDAGRIEMDQSRRRAIYHELHALLAEEQPYTWTVQPTSKWAVSRRVRGVKEVNGIGLFLWRPGPYAWWIPEAERIHDRAAPAPSP
jgi:peptide/nickel transport system substrate-binding protein